MPFADSGGIRINWDAAGSGPPVLFLHGLGGSLLDWDPQIPDFSPRYRVIRCDVRGHGKSDRPPGPYQVEDFTADVTAVLHAAGVKSAHVVGLSMGGMIALQLAVDAPDRVRSLVLANTGPEIRAENIAERVGLWQRRLLTRLLPIERWATILADRLFPGPDQGGFRRDFIERWGANDQRAYRDSFQALLRWSVAARLAEIWQPALVVHAEFDYTTLERKQRWANRLPNARVATIAGARHAVSIDSAAEFDRVVLEFLGQVGQVG